MNAQSVETAKIDTPAHPVKLVEDVEYARPEGFPLTLDIYTPETESDHYPVILMIHGGGWLINDNSIMDESARYLAGHGEYVVVNINYRLLGDQDNTVTMDEIVGDVFGALLWVKENIGKFGGNPDQIIVTGDSAGGHLATSLATQGHRLTADGTFGPENDFHYRPSYLPKSGIPEEGVSVQGAMISYGAFDMLGNAQGGFETSGNIFWQLAGASARGIFGADIKPDSHADYYKAVSPTYLVQPATEMDYPPMLFTVGSKDNLTTPASIRAFMDKVSAAGHDQLTYWENEGRPHAFLDGGSNEFLGIEFNRDAIPALNYMLDWLEQTFQ